MAGSRKTTRKYHLIDPEGNELKLPKSMQRVLADLAEAAEEGAEVTVIRTESMLTTQQAAELIGVSRQYVVRLVDEGRLPCEMVGSHRRLRVSDVMEFKRRREAMREVHELGQSQRKGGYSDNWKPDKDGK